MNQELLYFDKDIAEIIELLFKMITNRNCFTQLHLFPINYTILPCYPKFLISHTKPLTLIIYLSYGDTSSFRSFRDLPTYNNSSLRFLLHQ